MLTNRNQTWKTHIERGDRVKLRAQIEESNRSVGIKYKYTFEKLNKVIQTGEGNMRIIKIIDDYFKEKIKQKESSGKTII